MSRFLRSFVPLCGNSFGCGVAALCLSGEFREFAIWDGWDGLGRRLGRPKMHETSMFIRVGTVGRLPEGVCPYALPLLLLVILAVIHLHHSVGGAAGLRLHYASLRAALRVEVQNNQIIMRVLTGLRVARVIAYPLAPSDGRGAG